MSLKKYGTSKFEGFTILSSNRSENPVIGFSIQGQYSSIDAFEKAMANIETEMPGMFRFEEETNLVNAFRVVSQPVDLEYYEDHRANFDRVFKLLSIAGCTSHNNRVSGMSISIDRTFIGIDDDEALVNRLFKFGTAQYYQLRRMSKWPGSDIASKIPTDWMPRSDIPEKKNDMRFNKTEAINIASKGRIELNFFRGTFHPTSIAARIKIVDKIARIIKDASIEEFGSVEFADRTDPDVDAYMTSAAN